MKKILWLTNYPSPYRVDFFNQLGKKTDLTVLFENSIEEQTHRNKDWFNTAYNTFKPIFLDQTKILNQKICFSVLTYVLNREYDYIVLGDYTTPTSIYAAFFLIIKKRAYAISIDGAYFRKSSAINNFIKHQIIRNSRFFFSSSQTSDEYLMRYGANAKNIYRYNFTSLDRSDILEKPLSEEKKNELKQDLHITAPMSVLIVGRFTYVKGIDFALTMASKLPRDIEYFIAGDAPIKEYQQLVEQYDLTNVHFIGFQKKEDLKRYYQACDLFVFPTRYDPWGLVVNEAMANGMPILSSDKSAAALHFIENGVNGYVYPVDNEEAFLDKMMLLYRSPSATKEMGYNNLMKIQNYSIEKMAEQHLDIFEK